MWAPPSLLSSVPNKHMHIAYTHSVPSASRLSRVGAPGYVDEPSGVNGAVYCWAFNSKTNAATLLPGMPVPGPLNQNAQFGDAVALTRTGQWLAVGAYQYSGSSLTENGAGESGCGGGTRLAGTHAHAHLYCQPDINVQNNRRQSSCTAVPRGAGRMSLSAPCRARRTTSDLANR